MEKFLLAADAARLLGITPAAVREAARWRRLPVAAVTPSGVRLFAVEDVEAYGQRRRERGLEQRGRSDV